MRIDTIYSAKPSPDRRAAWGDWIGSYEGYLGHGRTKHKVIADLNSRIEDE